MSHLLSPKERWDMMHQAPVRATPLQPAVGVSVDAWENEGGALDALS